MKDQRQLLREVKTITPNKIEALAYVPDNSPWFLGHFPNEPILPGIALINLTQQAIIEDAKGKGEEIIFAEIKRVRFTGPVLPGESLKVNINHEEAGEETLFAFKITAKENIVCSGVIVARKK